MSVHKKWVKSPVQNLLRSVGSGVYFGRAKVGNSIKYKSLKTTDYKIAQLALVKFMESIRRQRRAAKKDPVSIQFESLLKTLEAEVRSDPELSAATVTSLTYSIIRLRKTWPELESLTPLEVSYDDVKNWIARLRKDGTGFVPPGAKKARKGNSSSTVNRTISTLARAIDISIKNGLLIENVARMDGLRVKDDAKKGEIPSRRDFGRILERLERREVYCATLLASTGARIEEARSILWRDVNFDRREIWIHGTKTKSSNRKVPITDQLFDLLVEYQTEIKEKSIDELLDLPIFPRKTLNKQLARACKSIGVPKITNHDLRDYFATNCLESGIPVHTVAVWLGHNDGGTLLLKTYAHLRDQHSIDVARKLKI
ncbi:MAG: tyrosine-type recombinase/integrase [Opitutales bacterium]